jgi:hypothetical protein
MRTTPSPIKNFPMSAITTSGYESYQTGGREVRAQASAAGTPPPAGTDARATPLALALRRSNELRRIEQ